jgi:methionyl-tRNA formyltransferase
VRILYLANNRLGLEVLKWLRDRGEVIAGLVVHPPDRGKFAEDIGAASGLNDAAIFDAGNLREASIREQIRNLEPDLGVCVLFGYVLDRAFLDAMPCRFVNLHPAFLPHNRGAFPNVWSIVDRTPAGVTLHFVDEGVDTGDIIAQRQVPILATDTGESLYDRLEQAALDLFRQTWPLLRAGQQSRIPQDPAAGSSHRARDVAAIDEIDLARTYQAGQLLDILRARTFPPHAGAYFRADGRKIYIRIDLQAGDEVPE